MNGGREDSFLRRPTSIGAKDPHALKIPARRAEYSLAENVASPFQAEPRQSTHGDSHVSIEFLVKAMKEMKWFGVRAADVHGAYNTIS
jgi:hypothetical protein